MSQILEIVMLICFGCSWPMSLIKNIKAKTAKSTSLGFIILIITGYLAGIISKFCSNGPVHWYVLFFYFLNLIVVSANLVVYFINRGYDKKAGTR